MSVSLKYSKPERPKQERELDRKVVDNETQTIPCGKPEVPGGYRDLLLEFTINYNLHHPKNIVEYAAEYFAALRDQKHTKIVYDLVCTNGTERGERKQRISSVAFSEDTAKESVLSEEEHGTLFISGESDSVHS